MSQEDIASLLTAQHRSYEEIVNDIILNSDNALYNILITGQKYGIDSVAIYELEATFV